MEGLKGIEVSFSNGELIFIEKEHIAYIQIEEAGRSYVYKRGRANNQTTLNLTKLTSTDYIRLIIKDFADHKKPSYLYVNSREVAYDQYERLGIYNDILDVVLVYEDKEEMYYADYGQDYVINNIESNANQRSYHYTSPEVVKGIDIEIVKPNKLKKYNNRELNKGRLMGCVDKE